MFRLPSSETTGFYQLRCLNYLLQLEDWCLRKHWKLCVEHRKAEATAPTAPLGAFGTTVAPFEEPAEDDRRDSDDDSSRAGSESGRTPAGATYRPMPDRNKDVVIVAVLFPDVGSLLVGPAPLSMEQPEVPRKKISMWPDTVAGHRFQRRVHLEGAVRAQMIRALGGDARMAAVGKLLHTSEAKEGRSRCRGKSRADDCRSAARAPVRRLGRFAKRLERHQVRMANEQTDYLDHDDELPNEQVRVAPDKQDGPHHGEDDEVYPDEESELYERETKDRELVAAFIKEPGKNQSWPQSRDRDHRMKRVRRFRSPDEGGRSNGRPQSSQGPPGQQPCHYSPGFLPCFMPKGNAASGRSHPGSWPPFKKMGPGQNYKGHHGCMAVTVAEAESVLKTADSETGPIMMLQHVESPLDTAEQIDEVVEKCQIEFAQLQLTIEAGWAMADSACTCSCLGELNVPETIVALSMASGGKLAPQRYEQKDCLRGCRWTPDEQLWSDLADPDWTPAWAVAHPDHSWAQPTAHQQRFPGSSKRVDGSPQGAFLVAGVEPMVASPPCIQGSLPDGTVQLCRRWLVP